MGRPPTPPVPPTPPPPANVCVRCNGTGVISIGGQVLTCPNCHGSRN